MPNAYYADYGAFLANNLYAVLLIPVLLLSLWAQFQVNAGFRRYSEVKDRKSVV